MSRRGNCLDNAPMESFFASLKKERIHHARFRRRTRVVSKALHMVEASIALFARFADHRGIDELLSMLA